MIPRRYHTATRVAVLGVCLAVAAGPLPAQSRNRVQVSSPGSLSRVGQGSTGTFRSYSYGLGGISSGGGALGGGNVLRSSVSRSNLTVSRPNLSSAVGRHARQVRGNLLSDTNSSRGSHSIRRSSPSVRPTGRSSRSLTGGQLIAGPEATPATLAAARAGAKLTTEAASLLEEISGPGVGSALLRQDDTAFGAARAYVQALEAASASLLADRSKPITSLVPKTPSRYREFMQRGDASFRAGDFRSAYADFQIANDLGDQDPESFLCLAHAQFALSRYTYAKGAYFLQQTLRFMPELPLTNLRPRGFYGDEALYAKHLVNLEDHVGTQPGDGEAQLMLAYFRWFSKNRDVAATTKALEAALDAAVAKNDARLAEAVETFWDGMLPTGLVEGKLGAGDQQEPATPEPQPEPAPVTPAG